MFKWDLTHFLDSIESPFVTFDGDGYVEDEKELFSPVVFDYQLDKNDDKTSEMSFPFVLPDLYLNSPLVLK